MRIAVLSDIHGNVAALDAVLDAASAAGAERYWVLGDHFLIGPRPEVVARRLMELGDCLIIGGNTDRQVLTGRPPTSVADADSAQSAPEWRRLLDVTASNAWTLGAVTAAGGLDWLAELPLERRTVLPDGTTVLLVHASPGRDDGPGITAATTDEAMIDLGVTEAGAELIVVGHTHRPLDRTLGAVRVINPGSVGLPGRGIDRAPWLMIIADPNGYQVERHEVEFDLAAVVDELDRQRHPRAAYPRSRMIAADSD